LEELDKALTGQAPISNSYDVAGSITGYLIETFGADKIPLMLGALAKGVDFDTVLQQSTGGDRILIVQQWRERLVTE